MHELTICQALLDRIAEERAARAFHRVVRVRVEVGRFGCLEPDSLRFAFDVISRDTFMQGAVLEIDEPPGRAVCLDCGAAVEVDSRLAACPVCQGLRLDPTGGDSLRFIEMEVA
ncbi:hydrogenase maturation nickel metallochaperone HypA [Azospirillum sp. ST 5-10]|uniref:hydrogenase maturation nickel metallochaperone HypA n=1 Tax=unclassified Azospirillum TaxID=2630922 RepID=UPI003F49D349